jgi:hypothetical protein
MAGWCVHGPEKDGCKRMERQSKELRNLEAYCRGGQGPPQAVAPFGGGNIGKLNGNFSLGGGGKVAGMCRIWTNKWNEGNDGRIVILYLSLCYCNWCNTHPRYIASATVVSSKYHSNLSNSNLHCSV